jgi:hypothetical protein
MVDATCEKCRTASGTPHTFHYGKKAGLPPVDQPTTYRSAVVGNMHAAWTEHYEVGGVDTVVVCDHCLAKARRRRAGRMLLRQWIDVPLITVLYILWAVAVVVWIAQGEWTQSVLWLGAGLGVTLVAYTVIYLILETEDFAQHAAMELHQEKLRSKGWDAFWTDREFMGLAPH